MSHRYKAMRDSVLATVENKEEFVSYTRIGFYTRKSFCSYENDWEYFAIIDNIYSNVTCVILGTKI